VQSPNKASKPPRRDENTRISRGQADLVLAISEPALLRCRLAVCRTSIWTAKKTKKGGVDRCKGRVNAFTYPSGDYRHHAARR